MELRIAYFLRAHQRPEESIDTFARRLGVGKGTMHRLLNAETGVTVELVDCMLARLKHTWKDLLRTPIPVAESRGPYRVQKAPKPVRRHRKARP